MVPPLDHFQGKNKNCSSLARTINASRRDVSKHLHFQLREQLQELKIHIQKGIGALQHNWKFLRYIKLLELKWKKNNPMVPPLDHFQGKNKNCSSLARTISTSRRSFFSNLTTFERRSGPKFFSPSQNRDFENGVIVKILKSQVLRRCPSQFVGGTSAHKLKWN